ncbi:hydantoinase B/oxoprolinase family protein [Microvirga alba]|uniref:Hydantoinase B/oxoprolinase family protein n=1 Tax=Microvirga alba TaxID=2791025 RepID=A0A931FU47_9HYPH|nr:hydantoinase B/oxoprolinase family protein [Microvirga alba]MBF9235281.1 hydantoinase B/oxoprolinase family protein [Microvirga alba]
MTAESKSAAKLNPTGLDPVTLEVLRNALPAISDEMSYDLQRTSYNMMIYEIRDYCTALLDTNGALISQNIGGVSHFVADLGVVIRDGIARYGLDGFSPGDVIMHNHQATAGQHLNNVVIYTPVYHENCLVAFAVVRAHWADVGGLSTGFGGTGAYDPWSEGLQVDQLKIYEKGEPDAKILKMIRDNIRYPDAAMGDLRSQLAACRLGERRFCELLDRYSRATVLEVINTIYAETEAKCRAAVADIPDGVYEAEAFVDGARGTMPFEIKVKVTVSGSEMEIDLSGCSSQRDNAGLNSRTYAGAYIAYKALTAPLEPLNEGAFGALKVVIPEGNMMMARFPAFMASWGSALPTVVDTIWRAFAEALPDLIPAAHSGSLGAPFALSGHDPARKAGFVAQSIEAGGWGGRPDRDGEDASMSVCQGDVRNTPIETMELKTPLIVLERALWSDSGGAGKFRGGLGVQTTIKSLVDGRWNAGPPGHRSGYAPWGLRGGKAGVLGYTLIRAPGQDTHELSLSPRVFGQAETEVVYRTSGGGGWGSPLERDPERVLHDVREGYVSAEKARDDYGVVLRADGTAVDSPATLARRAELAREGAH